MEKGRENSIPFYWLNIALENITKSQNISSGHTVVEYGCQNQGLTYPGDACGIFPH